MLSTEIPTCSSIIESDMSSSSKSAVTSGFSNLKIYSSWGDVNDDCPSPILGNNNNNNNNKNLTLGEKYSENIQVWKGKIPSSISGIYENPSSCSSDIVSTVVSNVDKVSHVDKPELVSKYITSDIRLTDTDGDIRLFHYVQCDDSSSEDIKSSRGIIRDGDKIVCKTFGYTPEISCTDIESVKNNIHSFSGCKVYDAEEGATVRLWFDTNGNKWRLSTHRKIDAYHSRWGNPNAKSFGDMFLDALQWECENGEMKGRFTTKNRKSTFNDYCESLDNNKNYTYLVRNSNENRIVCDVDDHPQAYFVGAFDRSSHFLTEGNDSGFPTPTLRNFETIDDLVSFVSNIDSRKKQGVIVYLPNQKQVKIMNKTYLDFFSARGNEPSIKYRYLHVRKDQNMVSMLYTLYPDHISVFEMYENILTDLSRKIHRSYVTRYINRQFVSLPQPEFFILQACHGWHIQDRVHNKISLEKVTIIIDSQPPTSLNKLIKPYIIRPISRTQE